MAKTIVIDRSSQTVRVFEFEARGSRVRLDGVTTIALPESPETADVDAARDQLAKALSAHAASGAQVIGLIGRTQAVLRDLRVPACPPEELPGIVKFQAMRELSFSVEQAAIDYDVVGADPDGTQRIILAALQQEVVERFRGAVSDLKLEVARLGLRPYATWRACRELAGATTGGDGAVLVATLADEALELTVASGDRVLFSRATMFRPAAPAGDIKAGGADATAALAAEIRRTIAAFANQTPGVAIARIIVPAASDEPKAATEALAAALAIPVDRVDPFQSIDVSKHLRGDSAGAPSAGAVIAAFGAAISAAESWPIDFLNPKKPVVPRDRKKPMLIAAAAAAALVFVSAYAVAQYQLSKGAKTIAGLTNKQVELAKMLEKAKDSNARYQAVDEWMKSETDAIEQLRRLSEEFPSTKDMYTTSLTISRGAAARGVTEIKLDGVSRQYLDSLKFLEKLNASDEFTAQPEGKAEQTKKSGNYRYDFHSKIGAKPSKPDAESTESRGDDAKTTKAPTSTSAAPAGAKSAPQLKKPTNKTN